MVDVFKYKLLDLLIKHEGLKLKPYKDTVGKLTIGIGRNLDDKGISKQEAIDLAMNDIQDTLLDLYDIFPDFNEYPENVKLVLCDMMFNLGKAKFLTFKKFINAIKNKDWKSAIKEMMDSKWAKQVKSRALDNKELLESLLE